MSRQRPRQLCLLIILGNIHAYTGTNSWSEGHYQPKQLKKVQPKFRSTSQVYYAKQGSEVTLECDIEGLKDNTVLWKQGERVISAGSVQVRKDERMRLVKGEVRSRTPTSLQITNLNVLDAGNYTCEIEWRGEPREMTHSLHIMTKPKIHRPFNKLPLVANEGENVGLTCKTDGDPEPTINWSKLGDPPHKLLNFPWSSGNLTLMKVDRKDAGKYMCTASNRVGEDTLTMTLLVQHVPEILASPSRVYSGPGGSARLQCQVVAHPPAKVTWFYFTSHRSRMQIFSDTNHLIKNSGNKYTLDIRNLRRSEMTNYTCQAENDLGTAKDGVEVTGQPEPPTINSADQSLQKDSYRLVFTVRSHSPILQASVRYRRQDSLYGGHYTDLGEWKSHTFNPAWRDWGRDQDRLSPQYRSIDFTINDLDNDMEYSLLVKAFNQFGWSDESKLFTFKTRKEDYASYVSNSKFHFSGSRNLRSDILTFLTALVSILILRCYRD